MKHSGMSALIQRFVIKRVQNWLLPGTSPCFPPAPPAAGSFDWVTGGFRQPKTRGLEGLWLGVPDPGLIRKQTPLPKVNMEGQGSTQLLGMNRVHR